MSESKVSGKLTMEQVVESFVRLVDPSALVRLKYICEQELLERSAKRMKESRRKRFGPREAANGDEVDGNRKNEEENDG